MKVEWRTGVGYGDFVTGLGYAHTSSIKYGRPVEINFHWSESKDHLFHETDVETLHNRCEYIKSIMRDGNVTVSHVFNSKPDFRFYNQLDEWNPLHGLWYSTLQNEIVPMRVVMWTSEHNVDFPGINKDPAVKHWPAIRQKLASMGYDVHEVTYRTPVTEVMELIRTCEWGIGYDGLAHQLFKFMWKPLVVLCKRLSLNKVLIPQAVLESNPQRYLDSDPRVYARRAKVKVDEVRRAYEKYLTDYKKAEDHELFNSFVY